MPKHNRSVHVNWNIENIVKQGYEWVPVCPCGGDTVLVVAPDEWPSADRERYIGVFAEVSAHVCVVCDAVVSVSVNIDHHPRV